MTKDQALLAWATAHAAMKAAEGEHEQARNQSSSAWTAFAKFKGSAKAKEALWTVYLSLADQADMSDTTYRPLVQATNDAWDAYAQAVLGD